MKKGAVTAGIMLAAMVSVAANISLYSNGADAYADGAPALTGECVALVWQRAGTSFAGFSADGWVVGEEGPETDCLVVGFYDDMLYSEDWGFSWLDCGGQPISLSTADGWGPYFSSGTFSVYLLDTRVTVAGEEACGFDPSKQTLAEELGLEGLPYRINAWQPFNGLTNLIFNSTSIWGDDESEYGDRELDPAYPPEEGYYIGTTAATPSALPADCPTACVSSFVVSDGRATVTVTNAASCLTYNIAVSNDVRGLAARTEFRRGELPCEGRQGGAGVLAWQIELPADQASGFFRLIRQPLK